MNKSALSYNVYANYSKLVESPKNQQRKRRFKKSMFARPIEEEEPVRIPTVEREAETGRFKGRDPDFFRDQEEEGGERYAERLLTKPTGHHHTHMHAGSFDIVDKERQCLQLSEKGNLWIILALLAGVCYAFNNFFLGQLSHQGLVAVIYVKIPSFAIFMTIYIGNAIRNKVVHGFYWSREISIFFKEEDDSIHWGPIIGVTLMSLFKFLGFCLVVVTFQLAISAGLNLGIVTVLFNFCCITDSVVFYFIFNEKLSRGQLLGTIVMLMSAYFISQKPGKSAIAEIPYLPNETEQQYLNRLEEIEMTANLNASLAILCAICCTFFFSARDVILRYCKITYKYPAFEISLDSLTLYSFVVTAYSVYYFQYNEFDWDSFYRGFMSAVLNTCGFMLLATSIVIGYAGPANALSSIQAIITTMLGVTVMNQVPMKIQVFGMCMGIFGTMIVTIGDPVIRAIQICMKGVPMDQMEKKEEEKNDVYKRLD